MPSLDRDGAVSVLSGECWSLFPGGCWRPAAGLPKTGEHVVQACAIDELHDDVVEPVVLSHAKHGDDIGVVQSCRGLCLALETPQMKRVQQRLPGQDLHGHVPAERFLERLVDDAHAAAADFAEDAEIAQAFQPDPAQRRTGAAPLLLVGLHLFHHGDGREKLLDLRRQVRVPCRVLGDRRQLAAALPLHEFGRQDLQRIAFFLGFKHGNLLQAGRASGSEWPADVSRP